jgi:hypothetical protein
VFQQTPRAVTSAPPLFVTLPPDTALVCVIPDTSAVVTSGTVRFLQECKIAIEPAKRNIITTISSRRFMGNLFTLKYLIELIVSKVTAIKNLSQIYFNAPAVKIR